MTGRTRVTCVDIDTGEEESIEIRSDQFITVCGSERYLHSDIHHTNGTNVVTIKTHARQWVVKPA